MHVKFNLYVKLYSGNTLLDNTQSIKEKLTSNETIEIQKGNTLVGDTQPIPPPEISAMHTKLTVYFLFVSKIYGNMTFKMESFSRQKLYSKMTSR